MTSIPIKALKISKINLNSIKIATKKVNKKVSILYNNKVLYFQTPFLNVSGELKKTPLSTIYQLDTLITDKNIKSKQLYEFIDILENNIMDQIINIGSKWFTGDNASIKSLIRDFDPKNNIFFIKWLIDLKNNIFINELKQPFDPNLLKTGDQIKLIIEIPSLWINENQCGLAPIIHKILVKSQTPPTLEYIFDESESDNTEDNEIINLLATEQKQKQKKQIDVELIKEKTEKKEKSKEKLKEKPKKVKLSKKTKKEESTETEESSLEENVQRSLEQSEENTEDSILISLSENEKND